MAERGLLKLLAWLSPAMPVGAYSYSHGLEQATEAAHVRDAPTLRSYIDASLAHGGARLGAGWLCASHIATAAGRCEELALLCRAERLEPPHACVLGVACAAHGIPPPMPSGASCTPSPPTWSRPASA